MVTIIMEMALLSKCYFVKKNEGFISEYIVLIIDRGFISVNIFHGSILVWF